MKPPLILVDGSSYFYRAFHALPPLTTSKGFPTGAIYGVANMVKRLIKTYDPSLVAVIFDARGKTFRNDWYPEYKAHRPPTPPDLSMQFEPLLALLKAMGLPIISISGVEADDVIATLALQAAAQGLEVLISTGDKDMAQLVNQHISLINTMSNERLDPAAVEAKFGIRPDQIIDYLSLVGDSADNVPGVHKCGPKTAVKWLHQYGSLDGLIAHADQIPGKIGESLRQSLAHLPLSKRLITLKTDVELDLGPLDLLIQDPDTASLQSLSQEYEFKQGVFVLSSNTNSSAPSPTATEPSETQDAPPSQRLSFDFKLITEMDDWENYRKTLMQAKLITVDTETTSIDALKADLVGIALHIPGQSAVYIPLMHQESCPQLSRDQLLSSLKPILENPQISKLGQNLKYDYQVFKHHGIHLQGIEFDTMLESYLLNSASRRHDLGSLAKHWLNRDSIAFSDIAGKGKQELRFDQIPIAQAAPYATEDVMLCAALHDKLYPLMSSSLKKLLHEIEMPLVPILADMESHGVLIAPLQLEEQGQRLSIRLKALEEKAQILAKQPFNLNSPKQLQTILFEEQGLPILAKTPTGQASTSEAVLQELALSYELPALILDYRSLSKLMSTYIEALPKRMNPVTHRVHTSYNQAVTATGRLSSTEPNLQNIPIRTPEGRAIRQAFIAPKGHVLLTADYSQIELRIMAHLSQDPQLIKAFTQGLDIHKATAAEIAGIPLEAVTSELRRDAKAVNFGLIYGMSAFGLAKQLGIDRQKAQAYIDRYFERYPGVLAYMDRTRELAHRQGFVETIFGRRLDLPEIRAKNMQMRKAAERAAINAPLQGTAADIIKQAMIAIASWQNQSQDSEAKLIMQVHDELVFEIPENALPQAKEKIQSLMEGCVSLSVPLNVSIGWGKNWDEAH